MKIHIVKKGDTLYSLSKKYGVSLDQLIAMNPQLVDPNQLSVGMKVKVPSANYPTGDYEIIHKHVVKEGDTLWKLSKAWGVPLNVMIAANPQLKNPNILLIGQVINIAKLGSEIIEEGDSDSNNKHANMMPKSKAEMLQSKVEMLQTKVEAVKPEHIQEQSVKEEQTIIVPEKAESPQPLEKAPEEVKSNPLITAKEEAAPIPLSKTDNQEYPIAPYAVYQPQGNASPKVSPQIAPYTAAMPTIPVLPEIVVDSGNNNNAAIQPNFSMENLVPCDPSLWSSGCDMNMQQAPYSWSGWGHPNAAGCNQGIYLGNCPPGTLPLSNWDCMTTQAYTMYTQYDPYKGAVLPTSHPNEMLAQSPYGMQSGNQPITGYSNSSALSENVMYGQYNQPSVANYSNMAPSNAINSLNMKEAAGGKARIEDVGAGTEAAPDIEHQAVQMEEMALNEGKSGLVKKSYKPARKKAKAPNAVKSRQKRGSIPWINA